MRQDSAAVQQGSKWGVIDAKGNYVVEPLFDRLESFAAGLITVWQGGKCGVIDAKGNYVVEPLFDRLEPFAAGLTTVWQGGQWEFNPDTPSAEVWVAVWQGDKWGLIDAQGNYVVKPQFDRITRLAFVLSEGLVAVGGWARVETRYFWGIIKDDTHRKLWGIIDAQGNYVFKPQFTEIRRLAEGWTAVRLLRLYQSRNPWWLGFEVGTVDEQGDSIVEFVAEDPGIVWEVWEGSRRWARRWGEGPRQWGIIDAQGNYIFEPQFDEIGAFADGFAVVKQDGKWGVIDMKGHYVVEPQFDWIGEFHSIY